VKSKGLKFVDSLKKIIESKIFLIVFSFIISWALWFYVNGYYNPNDTDKYDSLPVTVNLEGSIPQQNGLTILSMDSVTVDIKVEGPRIYLTNLKKDAIEVYVDMDSVTTAGSYSLPIVVTLPNADKLTISSQSVSRLNVVFDKEATKSVPVEVKTVGSPLKDYMVGNITVSPTSVSVTGPQQILDTIDTVPVNVDVSSLTKTTTLKPDVVLYDRNGAEVEAGNITTDFETLSINVPIYKMKKVPLAVTLVNSSGGDDSGIVGYSVEPAEITIAAAETELDEYNQLILGTVDTSKYDGDTDIKFDLTLPSGVTVVDDISSVQVKLTFSAYHTKSITLPNSAIVFNNVPEGVNPTVASGYFTVKVRGIPSSIENIDENNIVANVDMSTVTATNGNVTLPITFTFKDTDNNQALSGKFGVSGKYAANVNLTK